MSQQKGPDELKLPPFGNEATVSATEMVPPSKSASVGGRGNEGVTEPFHCGGGEKSPLITPLMLPPLRLILKLGLPPEPVGVNVKGPASGLSEISTPFKVPSEVSNPLMLF